MVLFASRGAAQSFAECRHVCAQLDAGFGCIDDADIDELRSLLLEDCKWNECGWAFIGNYAQIPGGNKHWKWLNSDCTTSDNWDHGQPNDHEGHPENCVAVHRDFRGWHDFPCCGWAQCICNTNIPIPQDFDTDYCQVTCSSDDEPTESMCAREGCAGCNKCSDIGLKSRGELCMVSGVFDGRGFHVLWKVLFLLILFM